MSRAGDKNTDLGDILSPPPSKKVKRPIGDLPSRNHNAVVKNENSHVTPKKGPNMYPRPQLSNVLKLQEIIPTEGSPLVNVIEIDAGIQSQGEAPATSAFPNEFTTFNQDQPRGGQKSKKDIFSRKIINL